MVAEKTEKLVQAQFLDFKQQSKQHSINLSAKLTLQLQVQKDISSKDISQKSLVALKLQKVQQTLLLLLQVTEQAEQQYMLASQQSHLLLNMMEMVQPVVQPTHQHSHMTKMQSFLQTDSQKLDITLLVGHMVDKFIKLATT